MPLESSHEAQWQRIYLPMQETQLDPWVAKIPWRRKWQPTPVFSPGEFHGQRSPAGYSQWRRKEANTTERTHYTQWLWQIKEFQCD